MPTGSMEMPHRMDIPKLALSVAVPQMAGAVGALFTYPLISGIQLALNVAWSALFFGLRNPGAGLVGIVLLWIAIAAAMRQFMKIDPRAAYMLAPYILWVTFAAVLNYYVWILNA